MEQKLQDQVEQQQVKVDGLEKKLAKIREEWDRDTSPIVTPDDIAELVSMWTGVPVMQMAQEESIRLLNMEEELHKAHHRAGGSH